MDLIDKKVLCELEQDCRSPLSKIAKKLRINRNIVSYRINNLERQGIIQKYICSLDLGRLGYKTYKLCFRLHNDIDDSAFVAYLLNNKQVINLLKLGGSYDYSCVFATSSLIGFDKFLMGLKTKFNKLIKDYIISIVLYTRIYKLEKLLLSKTQDTLKSIRYSGEGEPIIIDDKDKLILLNLSQKANMSIIELAKKTGLSVDVVKYRINRLNKTVVNSFRILFDIDKLGYFHYFLLIRTRQATKSDESKLFTWASMKKNVLYCTKRIGEFDFSINFAVSDIDGLNRFIEEFKSEFSKMIDFSELVLNNRILKLNYVPF